MQRDMVQETKPWVLVSNIKENANLNDLKRIAPEVSSLVDEWRLKVK